MLQRLINAGIEESEAKKEISILQKEIKDLNKIEEILNERIRTRKPLQYLLGKAYFMDFEVEVNENVLIPRPETEILVEETVKRLSSKRHCEEAELVEADEAISRTLGDCHALFHSARNDALKILDIGTGSGVIPIALAKEFPESKITSIDISKEIIELAERNAIKNNVKINLKICDIFSKCFEGLIQANDFDLIISNPPYVKYESVKSLSPEVQHEPKEALSGNIENKSGITYYERILEVLSFRCHSERKTLIALEIDPSLVKDLKSLMGKHGIKKFEIVKDYSKLDRYLFISI